MAVYFTSSVPNGNTEAIPTERIAQHDYRKIAQYDYRKNDGVWDHVMYVPGVGKFTSTDIEELEKFFGQISGMIGLEKFKITRPEWNRSSAGNSGSH